MIVWKKVGNFFFVLRVKKVFSARLSRRKLYLEFSRSLWHFFFCPQLFFLICGQKWKKKLADANCKIDFYSINLTKTLKIWFFNFATFEPQLINVFFLTSQCEWTKYLNLWTTNPYAKRSYSTFHWGITVR